MGVVLMVKCTKVLILRLANSMLSSKSRYYHVLYNPIQFSLKTEALRKEVRAIRHEIQLLKTLQHPNIVKYYYSEISEDG